MKLLAEDRLAYTLLSGLIEYPTVSRLEDLEVAIIGFGKMGILHSCILNLLKPGLVKYVVDKSRLIRIAASKLLPNLKLYRSLESLLSRENPEVFYVTTPSASHYAILSRLLDAGVENIFVEKPPTANSSELQNLLDKLNPGSRVMVGFQKRFALPFLHLKRIISEKMLGELEEVRSYIRSSYILSYTGRFKPLNRGVLLDLGVHLVDLLVWIFGLKSVEYAYRKSLYTDVDDYFTVKLTVEGGIPVTMEASWSTPGYRLPETYIEAAGSEGLIKATEDYLKLESTDPGVDGFALYKPHYYRWFPPVNVADPEWTVENLHFLYTICRGLKPVTSLEAVFETMKFVDDMYEAAGENRGNGQRVPTRR